MAKSIADILDAAADLIEPEGAWTQGQYARGKKGQSVETRRSAVCFCVLGAINVASGNPPACAARPAQRVLEAALSSDPMFYDVPDWNDADGRTQAEVVAKLREAAKLAREQQS